MACFEVSIFRVEIITDNSYIDSYFNKLDLFNLKIYGCKNICTSSNTLIKANVNSIMNVTSYVSLIKVITAETFEKLLISVKNDIDCNDDIINVIISIR